MIGLLVLVAVFATGAAAIDYVQASGRGTPYQQWSALTRIASLVRDNYVEEVNQERLLDGAIEGMLTKLDPHSTYIAPENTKQVQERFEGEFEGIGIHFDVINGFLTVMAPIPGSPADAVGLRAGDKIVKIDGKSALGIKENQVMERLKGPKGTKVRVTVSREGEENPLEFTITRDKIEISSVQAAFMIRPDVGYIWITRFSRKTAEEFDEALQKLKRAGMKRLILNLRNNGGGYLDQAVQVVGRFIDKGQMVVYTRGRKPNSSEEHYAQRGTEHPLYPVIVMINSASASASEIVAGALQDHDRALIVGQTSFGKGLVQNKFDLQNGGAVLLTVARYYTPSGRLIQRPYTEDRMAYIEGAGASLADSGETAKRPVYYTMNRKRKVYGGGGIAPDVALKPDTLSALERRLDRENILFEFANRYASAHRSELNDLGRFIASFELSRRDLADIRRVIEERGIGVREEEFEASLDFIRRVIMQEIAVSRWGRDAQYQVNASLDPEVRQALNLFDQAEQLVADRNGEDAPGAASRRGRTGEEVGRIR
jgi:carboxyl-terminal processing protease